MRVPRPLTKNEAQKEFLALLEGIVRDLPSHPENPNIRTPRVFIPLTPLAKFVRRKIEPFVRTMTDTFFTFYWSFTPGNSGMVQINSIRLPNGDRVFWFLNDWHDWDQQHFVGGVAAKTVCDLEFPRLLFKRNGKDFGHDVRCPTAADHHVAEGRARAAGPVSRRLPSLTDRMGLFAR
jgi:hypothetical protein